MARTQSETALKIFEKRTSAEAKRVLKNLDYLGLPAEGTSDRAALESAIAGQLREILKDQV